MAFADVLVAVDATTERFLAVVEVDRGDRLRIAFTVNFPPHGGNALGIRHIVASSECVAGIEAVPDPLGFAGGLDDAGPEVGKLVSAMLEEELERLGEEDLEEGKDLEG